MGIINYQTSEREGHSGFDAILKSMYDHANFATRLGHLIATRRILWVDRNQDNNNWAISILQAVAPDVQFRRVDSAEGAMSEIENHPFDLIISARDYPEKLGLQLLRAISVRRASGARISPVIIFASSEYFEENRHTALVSGAASYTCDYEDLFSAIETLCGER
jgi:CheY-like chemotaxis protein